VVGLDSGDLIIANHVSYVELLYLAFRYAPTFATIVYDPQSNGPKVVCQGILGALMHVMLKTSLSDEKGEKLGDVVRKAKEKHWGPVVVFPEGCTTNGKAILRFQNVFEGLDAVLKETNTKIHIIGFR
jgi:1-acyl-sn-glycerol-3-phosphate acyltransferase